MVDWPVLFPVRSIKVRKLEARINTALFSFCTIQPTSPKLYALAKNVTSISVNIVIILLSLQVKLGALTLSERARRKMLELAGSSYDDTSDTVRLVGKR